MTPNRRLSWLMFLLLILSPLAQAGWQLDAVLDTRAAREDGIPVLAVTPGGAADRLGLRPGDHVLAINGMPLRGNHPLQRTLEQALAAGQGQGRLLVLRNGDRLALSGPLSPVGTRSAGCAWASDRDPTPHASRSIWPAEITQIDGKSTPLGNNPRLTLDTGTHVLVVREAIPDHRFNNSQQRERRWMKDMKQAGAYKALVLEVAPDRRYSIGAQLKRDTMDNAQIRDNAYWEPVVFAERTQECR